MNDIMQQATLIGPGTALWHRWFEVLGGTTMILVGLYLLNEYFFIHWSLS